jgi:hypothetical protein
MACHETKTRRTVKINKEEEEAIVRCCVHEGMDICPLFIAADGCLKVAQ